MVTFKVQYINGPAARHGFRAPKKKVGPKLFVTNVEEFPRTSGIGLGRFLGFLTWAQATRDQKGKKTQ